MIYGLPLSSTQLNATASATLISGLRGSGSTGLLTTTPVPGTFTYWPSPETVLEPGLQMLSVTFTPANIASKNTNYAIAWPSVYRCTQPVLHRSGSHSAGDDMKTYVQAKRSAAKAITLRTLILSS